MTDVLSGLALVVVLSVAARLLASTLRIPAIVPLLAAGALAGGATGLIDPPALLGEALSPSISIAVGIILFEGALGLRWADLGDGVRGVVTRLITVGVLVTWVLTTIAILLLFDFSTEISVLIGAILIVSGPTVVIPMLDFIRPAGAVRSTLRWEGILIDPIGAIIAVLAFNAIDFSTSNVDFRLGEFTGSILIGAACGLVAALILLPMLGSPRLSGRDKVAACMMMVVGSFAAADAIHTDAGLAATIATGLVLANQTRVDISGVVEFSETLVPLLIGVLFVLLAANVELAAVADLGLAGLVLIAVIVLVVRPLAVLASTWRSSFGWRERTFFAAMAPKGIVAASTASVFGAELATSGVPGADQVVPMSFLVIAGTVLIYALGGPALARGLGVAAVAPPRVLMVGAPAWAVAIGRTLAGCGVEVRAWPQDGADAERIAAEPGLELAPDPLLGDENIEDELIEGVSAVLLLSDDHAFNSVLAAHFTDRLDPSQVYIAPAPDDARVAVTSAATPLFDTATAERIVPALILAGPLAAGPTGSGPAIVALPATEAEAAGATVLVSVSLGRGNRPAAIRISTPGRPVRPGRGDTVIALVE